jgi:hypothetical protein
VASVSTGAKSGVSREIIVESEAELKKVLDFFNREMETIAVRYLNDFADGRLP